jgi:hexosaminidase
MAAALRPRLLVLLAVAAAATGPSCAGAGRVDLWPMPASVARGAQTLLVSKDLRLSTAGSSYPDGKGILTEAFRRMVAVVELDHAINGTYSRGAPVLAGVHVAVRSPNDEVGVGHRQSHRLDWILVELELETRHGHPSAPCCSALLHCVLCA